MFIFDGPPERGGGVYYTNGRTKWGVANEASLVFFATGKVPHLGVLPAAVFDALPWDTSGQAAVAGFAALPAGIDLSDEEVERFLDDPRTTVAPSLQEAMTASSFETGDPGCG